MSYDTYEAARLLSWSNKQAGLPPLTEAELTEWIDAGVGGLGLGRRLGRGRKGREVH